MIGYAPRGSNGLVTILFIVPELGRTFAELSPEEKNRISHRSRAMRGMLEILERVSRAQKGG